MLSKKASRFGSYPRHSPSSLTKFIKNLWLSQEKILSLQQLLINKKVKAMFNSIEINRFRGIRHSKLDGLKQINLFFGKNNCGKSSLLDAIFLISGLSNPKLPLNINIMRNYRRLEPSDMILDFFSLDIEQPIEIVATNEEKRQLLISAFETSNSKVDLLGEDNDIASTDSNTKYGLVLKCKIDDHAYESSIVMSHSTDNSLSQRVQLDANYKEKLSCRYLNPKFDFYTSVEGLVDVIKNKDESFIIDALRLIEPRLKDFVLSQNEVLVDIGLDKRIPINMMGDGARKILSILTTIYECKDGIVLIDEISNGFHYSVMKGLWLSVISAAQKNHVQIFATTHDLDSIKGLRDAAIANQDLEIGVSCFKLLRAADSELKSYPYSLESVDYSLTQDIEIR